MSRPESMSLPSFGLRELWTEVRWRRSFPSILSGSLVMLFGTALVSVINFTYNVAMARMLGPSLFGHAAVFATMLMMVSALTLSFQMVGAKFIARNETTSARSRVYSALMRRAWFVGTVV